MVAAIIAVFVAGYLFIALESLTKINKAGTAIMMCVVCWVLYAAGGFAGAELPEVIQRSLGEAGTTLFFLMGAMAIVELVDSYGGFNFVRRILQTTSKKELLWKMAILTAVLSAILDNLTTTIVMLMILNKMVADDNDKLTYASSIVIAANAGGAFSPIGDVTTIMLWNGGMLSAVGVIKSLILPSIASFVVPCLILQNRLQGSLVMPAAPVPTKVKKVIRGEEKELRRERQEVFIVGVGGLCCVPVFHTLTGLPPFMGILAVLAILWVLTDFLHRHVKKSSHTITQMFGRIDMSTIMFFLGILMSVSVLSETGVLTKVGIWLSERLSSSYVVAGIIGVLSSIVDNVPLVAGAMKMYPIADAAMVAADPALANMVQDGIFWQLLAYCAGVGGSMLIIGSAAGVVAMGTENISFGWYMKKITWIALLGYLSGIAVYALEDLLFIQ